MIYLGLGSNLGDLRENIGLATERLVRIATDHVFAFVYETEPVGSIKQPNFLNTVVGINTSLSPLDLLSYCQEIEGILGRTETVSNDPRTMDVDLLLYNDMVISQEDLVVPHPKLQDRLFVLKPLYDIAPDVVHPVLNKTIRQLYNSCDDNSRVTKLF